MTSYPGPSLRLITAIGLLSSAVSLGDDAPVTLENHIPPTDLSAQEKLSAQFSYDRAVRAIDHAAMDWQESHSCVTCHTNGFYLIGRASAGVKAPAYLEARKFARDFLAPHVTPGAAKPKGRAPGDMGMVSATAFLAISDIATEGKLGKTTRHALDQIWKRQATSGAWEKWAKCNWGPYESDDHFGPSLVALAMGMAAKDDYTKSPAALSGDKKLVRYLTEHAPISLHQKGMLLWASGYRRDLTDKKVITKWQEEFFAVQRENGGWVLPELGDENWKRADGKEQSNDTDAYATAFAIHVLSESGVPRNDARLAKARIWLKSQQRESGRWYTRSPHKDNKHYISNAATNFALMALAPEKE